MEWCIKRIKTQRFLRGMNWNKQYWFFGGVEFFEAEDEYNHSISIIQVKSNINKLYTWFIEYSEHLNQSESIIINSIKSPLYQKLWGFKSEKLKHLSFIHYDLFHSLFTGFRH